MKRNEFFKLCAGGACGCAGLTLIPGSSVHAENPAPENEDWRIGFMQERFAKLISIMGDQLGEKQRNEILELMGRECAKHYYERALRFKGDLKGYLDDIQKDWVEKVSYTEPIKEFTVTDKLVGNCACPFVDKALMDQHYCHCSVGWQKEIYSLVTGKEVEVTIESSVLQGDQQCVFKMLLKDEKR